MTIQSQWLNVQDSYTHMYISCINSLLALRSCSSSVPMRCCGTLKGVLNKASRGRTGDHPRTSHCCQPPGEGLRNNKTASPLGWGELLLITGGRRRPIRLFLLPSHYQGIPPTFTSARNRRVQNDLHGLPVKRKRRSVREIVF